MLKWNEFMAPLLRTLEDGKVRSRRDLYEEVAQATGISDVERVEVLPSGEPKYQNRISWAISYLNRAGALERPARARFRITQAGRDLLSKHPTDITERDLRAFAGAAPGGGHTWFALQTTDLVSVDEQDATESDVDPTEQILEGVERINTEVAADLLARLHEKEPVFFEQAVVRLLVAMGYGGVDGQARVTQQTRDGGIDGIIDQDPLGLSRVFVQAKRYAVDLSVQRPELQAFVGALSGKADTGVFITTGRFSQGAKDYANRVPTRVILIDGKQLARLMIKYGVGVQVRQHVEIVDVDEDFFE